MEHYKKWSKINAPYCIHFVTTNTLNHQPFFLNYECCDILLTNIKQYRQEICDYLENEFSKLSGEIECDESYFGGRRKGNRGSGAKGKVTVFGMLERKGKIYTTLVDNVSAETLMGEIKRHAEKGSVFYTDKFRSYKSLTFFGKHITVDHGSYFANGRRHVNGLEGFWSFAKERFLKYHGVSKRHFLTYLKEMEFRYNYRKEKLFHFLINNHFGPFLS